MSKKRMTKAYEAAKSMTAVFEQEFERRYPDKVRARWWRRLVWWLFPEIRERDHAEAKAKRDKARQDYIDLCVKKLAHRAVPMTRG